MYSYVHLGFPNAGQEGDWAWLAIIPILQMMKVLRRFTELPRATQHNMLESILCSFSGLKSCVLGTSHLIY